MPRQLDRGPQFSNATFMASLVAAVACATPADSRASGIVIDPKGAEQTLPARIATIVEHVRRSDPALVKSLPPELRIVQFRND
jgi:hypothetical protein